MLTRILFATCLLFGPATHAQEPGGEAPGDEELVDHNDEWATRIEAALALDPEQGLDAAVAAAWEVRFELAQVGERKAQAEFTNRVLARLEEIDPHYRATNKDCAAGAKRLATQAMNYARLEWFDVANRLLDDADRLELGSTTAVRDRITKDRGGEPQQTPESSGEENSKPLLHRLKGVDRSAGWRRSKLGYFVNLEGRPGAHLNARGTKHKDARISVDIYPPENGLTQAGLMFGKRGSNPYLLLDAAWFADEKEVHFRLYEVRNDVTLKALEDEYFPMVQTEDGPRIRIIAEVRGNTVRFGTDGAKFTTFEYTKPLHGSIGFAVSGHGEHVGDIEFRNLTIDPLPPPKMTGPATDEATLAALRELVRDGQKLTKYEEPEEATMEFLSALDLLPSLSSLDSVEVEREGIDTHWSVADPEFRKHRSAKRHVAKQLTNQGDTYLKSGHVRTALVILDEAARLDPLVAFESRARALSLLAR